MPQYFLTHNCYIYVYFIYVDMYLFMYNIYLVSVCKCMYMYYTLVPTISLRKVVRKFLIHAFIFTFCLPTKPSIILQRHNQKTATHWHISYVCMYVNACSFCRGNLIRNFISIVETENYFTTFCSLRP